MTDLTALPKADPLKIYRYRDGLYAVDLLTAAIVFLDFFTWLSSRPSDLETICRELKLAPRPTDVMLTLFASNDFVRSRDGVFEVTDRAREFLVAGSPWFMGPYYASLKSRPIAADYLQVLRSGKPANWGSFQGEKEWSKAMETEEFAVNFTAAMDCRGLYLGAVLAEKVNLKSHHRLLDIAGGSGIYACALAARHQHLRATVFEKSPVDRIARTMIARRNCSERVSVEAGDMFVDPLPRGFDLHLYSNVLHDWDVEKVRVLLAASFSALEPGGMLMIHDAHLDADKRGPLPVAEYSALLMHSTEGKCYSREEMKSYLNDAGFSGVTFTETAVDRSVMTATKPR